MTAISDSLSPCNRCVPQKPGVVSFSSASDVPWPSVLPQLEAGEVEIRSSRLPQEEMPQNDNP